MRTLFVLRPIKCVLASLLITVFVILWSYFAFGGPSRGLAYLAGHRLVLSPLSVDVGEGSLGTTAEATFEVTNLGREPVTLVGATSTCACTAIRGLPVVVGPRKTHTLAVEVSFVSTHETEFKRRLAVFSDSPVDGVLVGTICGRVAPTRKTSE